MGPVGQVAELAGVEEEGLAPTVAEFTVRLVAVEKPEAGRDLGCEEELTRQGDHAVHEVGLDQGPADVPLARLVRRHRPVGQDEPGDAVRGEVVDDVLDPGEVGVAHRRRAVPPSGVFAEPVAAPVADVERRVGQDEVGLQILAGRRGGSCRRCAGRGSPRCPGSPGSSGQSFQVVGFDSWP